jgi:CRISPR type III-A-associated RAMP protein Csm4
MNPGLVVKLRPTGPWRIGPDSGARNRVDVIYHSDSLYSAVTSAMSRMGSLEEWLDATARSQTPAASFSSCFPFLDDIGFVVPPRTIWPPTSPAAMSARVRWKSARFIPLSVVESILSGKKLNENQWSVDGASGCLVPTGKPGPFRTSVRWNAAVDRLSGASERHATACIEFREGCGLWTVVGFPDDAARDQWQEPVKAAFRLLADTGFGGERSRGWGRAETPEFVEGTLPGLIIEYKRREPRVEAEAAPPEAEPVTESVPEAPLVGQALSPANAEAEPVPEAEAEAETLEVEPIAELGVEAEAGRPETEAVTEPATEAPSVGQALSPANAEAGPVPEAEAGTPEVEPIAELGVEAEAVPPEAEPVTEPAPEVEGAALEAEPVTEPAPEIEAAAPVPEPGAEPTPEAESAEPASEPEPTITAAVRAPDQTGPMRVAPEPEAAPGVPLPAVHLQAHWLLSLFTPAADDTVDWGRGSYTVLARGGRIDSPSLGSGELKKQIQMVAEGSVLYADGVPLGAAADVAPDGFAHPVFRAGFAMAIPLPEVH